MYRFFLNVTAAYFLLCTSASAQPFEPSETLATVIEQLYQHNPRLEVNRASTRAAQERVNQARAQFGPTLSGDGNYAYSWRRARQNGSTLLRQGGFSPLLSLSADQPLFSFGRLAAQHRVTVADYRSSVADLSSAEQDLIAEVIVAYVSVLRDERLVGIAQENLAQLNITFGQIEARYNSRYATETERQQTRNRIFSGQAQVELAKGNLLASRNAYRNLTGHYPTKLAPLPRLPALPETLEIAQEAARTYSPLLERARLQLAAAQGRVGQARGNTRPYLSIQGNVTRSPLSLGTDDAHELNAEVQVGIRVPLYSGGLLSAQVREAAQLADGANQQLEQVSRDVRESVASYWDQLAATRRALPAYAGAVAAAQAALDGAEQQQLAGQVTSLDVLDTARDLLTSRQARAQAEAQLYMQHTLLLGAMGRLRSDDFSRGAPPFDPDAYAPFSWKGLPSGPLIHAIDAMAVDDSFNTSPVAVEKDTDAGHEMAPEPLNQGVL